ncbi:hypothetical protein ACHAWF_018341 [Thalassiosira exigua]
MAASDEEIRLHNLLARLFLFSALPTYLVTRYLIVAPFGRHVPKASSSGYRWWYGRAISARCSWFLFECPNLLWSWYCLQHWRDPDIFSSTNAILLFLFTLHYVNRSIIYPLRMNPKSQKVPLIVTVFAILVTSWNGYLQCFYLVQVVKFDPLSLSLSLDNMQRWLGICLFFVGMGVNVHSDGVLRNLRRRGPAGRNENKQQSAEHEYYIPRSPFFKYISCPNLAGEILEWFGFALASQFSLPSVAFFVYTSSNLIPRAVAHHEWYLRKFDDYPTERKWALIPFVV